MVENEGFSTASEQKTLIRIRDFTPQTTLRFVDLGKVKSSAHELKCAILRILVTLAKSNTDRLIGLSQVGPDSVFCKRMFELAKIYESLEMSKSQTDEEAADSLFFVSIDRLVQHGEFKLAVQQLDATSSHCRSKECYKAACCRILTGLVQQGRVNLAVKIALTRPQPDEMISAFMFIVKELMRRPGEPQKNAEDVTEVIMKAPFPEGGVVFEQFINWYLGDPDQDTCCIEGAKMQFSIPITVVNMLPASLEKENAVVKIVRSLMDNLMQYANEIASSKISEVFQQAELLVKAMPPSVRKITTQAFLEDTRQWFIIRMCQINRLDAATALVHSLLNPKDLTLLVEILVENGQFDAARGIIYSVVWSNEVLKESCLNYINMASSRQSHKAADDGNITTYVPDLPALIEQNKIEAAVGLAKDSNCPEKRITSFNLIVRTIMMKDVPPRDKVMKAYNVVLQAAEPDRSAVLLEYINSYVDPQSNLTESAQEDALRFSFPLRLAAEFLKGTERDTAFHSIFHATIRTLAQYENLDTRNFTIESQCEQTFKQAEWLLKEMQPGKHKNSNLIVLIQMLVKYGKVFHAARVAKNSHRKEAGQVIVKILISENKFDLVRVTIPMLTSDPKVHGEYMTQIRAAQNSYKSAST